MAQLIDRYEQLIAKSQRLRETSNPTDVEEMQRLVEKLRAAVARRSQAEMEGIAAELEDLVFYLQDA